MIEKMNSKMVCILVIEFLIIIVAALSLARPITNVTLTAEDLYEIGSNNMTQLTEDNTLVLDAFGETCWIWCGQYELGAGAYKLRVTYDGHNDNGNRVNEQEGTIHLSSSSNPSALMGTQFQLNNQDTVLETTFWVDAPAGVEDLVMHLYYAGTGTLSIESIEIQESYNYRIVTLFQYIGLIVCFNILWYVGCYSNQASLERNKRIVYFASVWFFSSVLLIGNIVFGTHDITFHFSRITSVAMGLEGGQFPVRLVTEYGNQYGYAQSLFYCDIFLYIPALLYNWSVPLTTCYQIYLMLVNAATLGIAYYAFKRVSGDMTTSIVVATIYTLSAYRFLCEYTRGAVGEITAMTFLPLVFAGLYCIYMSKAPQFKDWSMLSLGMSGIILSHMLSTQIVASFVVVTCLILIRKTWRPEIIIALLKAILLTVLLTCWYSVPFLQAMSMPIMEGSIEFTNKIQGTGIYWMQLLGLFSAGTGVSTGYDLVGEMSLTMGLPLVIGVGIMIYALLHYREWKREDHFMMRALLATTVFTAIASLCTLRSFPWDSVEQVFGTYAAKLAGSIQFSWRYLSMVTIGTSLGLLIALTLIKKYVKQYYTVIIGVLLGATVLMNGYLYADYMNTSNLWMVSSYSSSDEMWIYVNEYLLEGTDSSAFVQSYVQTEQEAVQISEYECHNQTTTFHVKNGLDQTTNIIVPIINYDYYQATDQDSGVVFAISNGDNNMISLELPAQYEGTIEVIYKPPFLWKILEGISALTLIGIIGYIAMSSSERVKQEVEFIEIEIKEEKEDDNEKSIL